MAFVLPCITAEQLWQTSKWNKSITRQRFWCVQRLRRRWRLQQGIRDVLVSLIDRTRNNVSLGPIQIVCSFLPSKGIGITCFRIRISVRFFDRSRHGSTSRPQRILLKYTNIDELSTWGLNPICGVIILLRCCRCLISDHPLFTLSNSSAYLKIAEFQAIFRMCSSDQSHMLYLWF
jgi:hypothetical protein